MSYLLEYELFGKMIRLLTVFNGPLSPLKHAVIWARQWYHLSVNSRTYQCGHQRNWSSNFVLWEASAEESFQYLLKIRFIGGYVTWLLRKHKCLLLVSNQTADGFRSSPMDLVMRINTLPKGTSSSPWFRTRVTGLREHCSTDWAIAPPGEVTTPATLTRPT